jgi:hypothetical protein
LKAAFDKAIKIMNSERPYRQVDGAWWKWEDGWKYIDYLESERESEAQA